MGGEDFGRFQLADPSIESLIFWVGGVPQARWDAAGGDTAKLPSLHSPFWAPDAETVIATATEAMVTGGDGGAGEELAIAPSARSGDAASERRLPWSRFARIRRGRCGYSQVVNTPRARAEAALSGRYSQCQGSLLTVRRKPNRVAFFDSQT